MKLNKTEVRTTKVVLELENEEVSLMRNIISSAYAFYKHDTAESKFADELTFDRNLGYNSRFEQLDKLSLKVLKETVEEIERAN